MGIQIVTQSASHSHQWCNFILSAFFSFPLLLSHLPPPSSLFLTGRIYQRKCCKVLPPEDSLRIVHSCIVEQSPIYCTGIVDISQYRLLFGFFLLHTNRVPFGIP
jgi:hypothetical protein